MIRGEESRCMFSTSSYEWNCGLMNREKWDEWFRDLAFRIVDVKVSRVPHSLVVDES